MKTDTKAELLALIAARSAMRPVELARAVQISPQALHRQLKALVAQGALVVQGRPPRTFYALAGVPDFSAAFAWISAQTIKISPTNTVCETRDVFAGRLSPLKVLTRQGLDRDDLPQFISVVGEIGNNSFDHNLGQWRDVPGCWFETQVTGNKLWVCIGDRGQGIYSSLSKIDPGIADAQAAMQIAFEKFVSGRAPEKRGNGLKYVKNVILDEVERGIACVSDRGRVRYGDWGHICDQLLQENTPIVRGTLTLMVWILK